MNPPSPKPTHQNLILILTPILALLLALALYHTTSLPYPACAAAAVTLWCAIWWITEPIPIPATSLLPLVLFPLLGVLDQNQIAAAYGHKLILLFLGGFMLSKAMEKSGAHKRLALIMVNAVGGRGGKSLILGFMLASAFLSMWISNTATVLMLLPMILAITAQSSSNSHRTLTIPLLLGVAYAASIGGIATPIGTPPNGVLLGVYQTETNTSISFTQWMLIGLPVVIVFLPIAWLWLTRNIQSKEPFILPNPGPWRSEEKRILIIFTFTAALWIFRAAPNGGWSALLSSALNTKLDIHDSTIALAMVLVMFITPNGKGDRLLDWQNAVKIPWGILLLFGGGLAIAAAFKSSGLSHAVGDALSVFSNIPTIFLILIICLIITFLTEVTSNTATATVLLPIIAAAAKQMDIDPLLLMAPAAMSASCAFMLPVATPPNAIVFGGSNHLNIKTMAREGFTLNVIGAVIITTLCYIII